MYIFFKNRETVVLRRSRLDLLKILSIFPLVIFINVVTSVAITFSLGDGNWCCKEKIDIGHSFDLQQASMYLQSSYSKMLA